MKPNRDIRALCIALHPAGWLCALGLTVALSLPALPTDSGDLDPTFGNNGKVVTILGQQSEWANDMIVQADGKTLVIGYSQVRAALRRSG